MPNPYPIELRTRAVEAYECGEGSYAAVANRFSVSGRTLVRWVTRERDLGSVAPFKKCGGWQSPVDLAALHAVVEEKPDGTTEELTRAYNRRVRKAQRVHRSSFLRALRRCGYVFKKNGRGPKKPTDPTCAPNASRICCGPRR
jgi:transposase